MIFDTERMRGVAWGLDETAVYLTWSYRSSDPAVGQKLFELILLSDDGNSRSRVWQWLEHGICVKRTLIDEYRVA
jgi:hypothetical protein